MADNLKFWDIKKKVKISPHAKFTFTFSLHIWTPTFHSSDQFSLRVFSVLSIKGSLSILLGCTLPSEGVMTISCRCSFGSPKPDELPYCFFTVFLLHPPQTFSRSNYFCLKYTWPSILGGFKSVHVPNQLIPHIVRFTLRSLVTVTRLATFDILSDNIPRISICRMSLIPVCLLARWYHRLPHTALCRPPPCLLCDKMIKT